MCVNPIWISQESAKHPANSVSFRLLSKDVQNILRPYRFSNMTVPCGKCIECLKDRQNDVALRVYLAASKYKKMSFITLTYSDSNLPFMATLCMVDKKTGDVIRDFIPKFVSRRSKMLPVLVDYFSKNRGNVKPRYFHVGLSDSPSHIIDNDYDYYVQVTPSLDRRGVRLWLKSARVDFERQFGRKLSPFKYIFIGEYGPRTCRPHVHCLFLGLTDFESRWLASRWSYGHSDVRIIPNVNSDGKSAFLAAAKYCAKYIAKGNFECDSVKDGYAEKPRLCTSVGLINLSQETISFYRCYDLFGNFNLNRFVRNDGFVDVPSLYKLHAEVKKRQRIVLNGFSYKLPKSIIKSLWYEKDNVSGQIKPTKIRIALSSFVMSDMLQDVMAKYKSCEFDKNTDDIFKAALAECNAAKIASQIGAVRKEQNYSSFISKSKF